MLVTRMGQLFVEHCNSPSANAGVAILGDLLVGLLAGTGNGTLDGLRDVVDGLLSGLHCEGCLIVWGGWFESVCSEV